MSSEKKASNAKKAKRNREITIRVNDYELAKIKKRNQGNTVASWVRGLALGVTPVRPVDPYLVRQLGRIGSNLNQLTKSVNTSRQLDRQVLSEIELIRGQLHELIDQSVAYSRSTKGEHDDC